MRHHIFRRGSHVYNSQNKMAKEQKKPELIPNKIVTEIEQAEEAEMGNPVPSQEKLEQLASWLTPELEKHALEIANLAMIGKIRAGENLSEVKAKLAPTVKKSAEQLAYKLVHAVKEIRF